MARLYAGPNQGDHPGSRLRFNPVLSKLSAMLGRIERLAEGSNPVGGLARKFDGCTGFERWNANNIFPR